MLQQRPIQSRTALGKARSGGVLLVPHCPAQPLRNAHEQLARNARRNVTTSVAGVQVKDVVTSATPPPDLKPAEATTRVWNEPSGQPGAPGAYGAAMVGRPEPLGATFDASTGAVNFAVVSTSAQRVTLVLFTEGDMAAGRATHEIPLDPEANTTGDVWHIMLPGVRGDLLYGYRVLGPHQDRDPNCHGHRHDESIVLLDPYAKVVLGRRKYGALGAELDYANPAVCGHAATWPQMAAALPPPADSFDWQGDRPLNLPLEQLVIYEGHVRGFTADPSSGVQDPGTYAGMTARLDYLASLGVNALELLPVNEFNELEYYMQIPGSDPPAFRYNFWGYSTVGFFAPMSRYSANVQRGGPPQSVAHEFKMLVREAHKRGIEVILDVVFNHTAEGNERGLCLSFRGLDNRMYYMLAPGGEYYNYSGCGNTLNCNHPVVRQFIVDCLKYWVTEYHVDGFRFDLASILTRAPSAWHPVSYDPETGAPVPPHAHPSGAAIDAAGQMSDGQGVPTGTPLPDPPLIEMISEDPVLRDTKMIAEAWDCDGLNQVGAFPHYGGRWSEWNGKFRDTVRNFIKGTDGWAGPFAAALCGSPDLYANNQPAETDWWAFNAGRKWRGGRAPTASINFVTAHDGFTLADVVAYNEKHNEANGEGNRDGEQHNSSWNCGEEGATGRWDVKRLRSRQMRNMAMALLLAHGVPMITMGDEYGHTKHGNNNTYCHDSPLNWLNWRQAQEDEGGFARFMRRLIRFRRSRPELQRTSFVTDRDVQWHGELPNTPDWTETSRLVAYTLVSPTGNGLFVAFNTSHTPKVLTLPKWPGRVWQPLADTSKLAPYDWLEEDETLSGEDVARARAAGIMYTADGVAPLLPWSAVIYESVPEEKANMSKFGQ